MKKIHNFYMNTTNDLNDSVMDAAEARTIASGVAQIITKYSYPRTVSHIALFGSALPSRNTKTVDDIDLLLLPSRTLNVDYEFATKYHKGRVCIDPERKFDRSVNDSDRILSDLGSPNFMDLNDVDTEIEKYVNNQLAMQIDDIRAAFTGMIHLDGESFEFAEETPYMRIRNTIADSLSKKYFQASVVHRVRSLMGNMQRSIENILDIQVLTAGMLDPTQYAYERSIAIQQSNDPAFWGDVLREGMLYNHDTHAFDKPIESVYRGAVALFNPSKNDAL